MKELRQVIVDLRTIDQYLDQFLAQKGEEFKQLIEENKKLKEEIAQLKASKE